MILRPENESLNPPGTFWSLGWKVIGRIFQALRPCEASIDITLKIGVFSLFSLLKLKEKIEVFLKNFFFSIFLIFWDIQGEDTLG